MYFVRFDPLRGLHKLITVSAMSKIVCVRLSCAEFQGSEWSHFHWPGSKLTVFALTTVQTPIPICVRLRKYRKKERLYFVLDFSPAINIGSLEADIHDEVLSK